MTPPKVITTKASTYTPSIKYSRPKFESTVKCNSVYDYTPKTSGIVKTAATLSILTVLTELLAPLTALGTIGKSLFSKKQPQIEPTNDEKIDNSKKQAKPKTLEEWSNRAMEAELNNKKIDDFDITGKEYRDALKNEDKNADSIYSEKAVKMAKVSIKDYDTNNDGAISSDELTKKESADKKKLFGNIDAQDQEMDNQLMQNRFKAMDLNKDNKIDEKEYAAFLRTIDVNADGKISEDEIKDSQHNFDEKTGTGDMKKFIPSSIENYKKLFNSNPETGK